MSERWRRRTTVSEQRTFIEAEVYNVSAVAIISIRVLKLNITHGEKEFSLVELMCNHLAETSASFEMTVFLLSFWYSSCNFALTFQSKGNGKCPQRNQHLMMVQYQQEREVNRSKFCNWLVEGKGHSI